MMIVEREFNWCDVTSIEASEVEIVSNGGLVL